MMLEVGDITEEQYVEEEQSVLCTPATVNERAARAG